MQDANQKTISKTSELIRTKQLSPVDIVKTCLDKIKELNPRLNAFITVLEDDALKSASIAEKEINQGKWKGVLHGIPIALKDFYDTEGVRTTAAFEQFKNRVPNEDAAVVKWLKDNGAILIGKTNMHTLGMGTTSVESYFGSVHNPINQDYVGGGSSGGSAAAVATGMCFATIDTDAVGSCRIPAACCGVIGFKVSNGLINMQGILAGEKSDEAIIQFSAMGITTRSVEDTEIILDILTPHRKNTVLSDKPLRIGVVQNFGANDEIRNAFSKLVEKIKSSEYATVVVEIPFEKAQFNLANLLSDRQAVNEMLFSKADLLLLPTLNDYIPTIQEAKQKGPQAIAPANTFFCNYFGLPAISIPYGKDSKGLPLAFQIVGNSMQDWQVLELAKSFDNKRITN
jgi:aspartyl-tRNA(Asn)/glutamyl-tRNA(Gln) amidotransferase subunit A